MYLLAVMLDSLEAKGTFISGSEYDKLLDKIYMQGSLGLATIALEELTESSKRTNLEEEMAYNDEKVFMARIHLILILIFKGKQKPDSHAAFRKLMQFLIVNKENQKKLELFKNYLINKEIITPENSDIFFSVINEFDAIDNVSVGLSIFRLYEAVFLNVNLKSGALDRSSNKKTILIIVKQERFVHLKQLWVYCLKSELEGSAKELFHRFLVECYFRSGRKYEALEAQKAWTYFNNDMADEMNVIRQCSDSVGKAVLLGNMANIWIKAIEISSGSLYIGGTSPSPETITIFVVIFVSIEIAQHGCHHLTAVRLAVQLQPQHAQEHHHRVRKPSGVAIAHPELNSTCYLMADCLQQNTLKLLIWRQLVIFISRMSPIEEKATT